MGMLQSQKTSVRGEGAYDSPMTFPIIPAPQNPLAFRRITSPLVYSEFGRQGGQSQLTPPAHLGPQKRNIGA
ncbi:hypothetical protein PILCRDRAFT_829321 [Piloderma croceum F 1598]|uniref:Uncharacterized protein n=1 Tax=Piloderma croceum (strain F 1598) TaxID=765440 RepID=A0A0C3EZ32_PILCF|nr:hypothetical protein PILCRDRAFT_830525 [Piloderma croceum F 1598]KIM73199.1 hypothetical protein PILCRDRAFT_829321 [Piloderma croceum F 1598]